MTHQQIIDRILADYTPPPKQKDSFRFGSPQDACTGIAVTCTATIDVIREAIRLGCNLLVVHEPTFYTAIDDTGWLEENPVYREKAELLRKGHITVFRDHDHMHWGMHPDEIMSGVMEELGWTRYADESCWRVTLPETTLRELCLHLKERLHLRTGRVVGNMDARVSRVVFCNHVFPSWDEKEREHTQLLSRDDVDVLIPGEIIDWTAVSYARDAAQLGLNKAIVQVGHFNWEEPGMKWLARRIAGIFPELPVHFVPSGDPYQFL